MFDSTNILVKIASGAFSGAVATALTNPTELLKVNAVMFIFCILLCFIYAIVDGNYL